MVDLDGLRDITLPSSDGGPVALGDLWRNDPVVIVWLRHYG
jgi:hypothetical protein